jgi:hypothetical protein
MWQSEGWAGLIFRSGNISNYAGPLERRGALIRPEIKRCNQETREEPDCELHLSGQIAFQNRLIDNMVRSAESHILKTGFLAMWEQSVQSHRTDCKTSLLKEGIPKLKLGTRLVADF